MWTSNAVTGVFVDSARTCGRWAAFLTTACTMVALVVVICCHDSLAQAVYGSIFGTVTDSSGAVVPNATITVTDVAKGTSSTVQTDASGEYRVQHLIPDTCSVSAEASGFKKATNSDVVVYADTAPKVDLQ